MTERISERELDAIVAEVVMGFLWDESRCRICGWKLARSAEIGCVPDNCSMRPAPKTRADEPAHYSTSIADAWRVVEKMRERHFEVSLTSPSDEVSVWTCSVHDYGYRRFQDSDWTENAITAPLAICLAALKALEAKP